MGCAGAKACDTYETFSESIRAGVLPSEESLDIQNVLERYRFEPGQGQSHEVSAETTGTAIYPTFHGAACRSALVEGVIEYFLLVRIHTIFDGQVGFRAPLRLVFVLDMSGSMGRYLDVRISTSTRLDVAKKTIEHICVKHLRAGDEMAIVTCNEEATVLLPLQPWNGTEEGKLASLKQLLNSVITFGGSNLKAGVVAAQQELRSTPPIGATAGDAVAASTSRLFVLTDFSRNRGEADAELMPSQVSEQGNIKSKDGEKHRRYGVLDVVKAIAAAKPEPSLLGVEIEKGLTPVYTTFLFVGLKLGKESKEDMKRLNSIVGCNGVTVTQGEAAMEHFDRCFECLVTPVARELRFELQASPFSPDRIVRCGKPENGDTELLQGDGEFFRARSIFPAAPAGPEAAGQSRGGVVLFELTPEALGNGQKPVDGLKTSVVMRVETAQAERHVARFVIDLPCPRPDLQAKEKDRLNGFVDMFDSVSIRKAVALHYYAKFSKQLLRSNRQSKDLSKRVEDFKAYFEAAASAVDDAEMAREVVLWDKLVEIRNEEIKTKKKQQSCCAVQ